MKVELTNIYPFNLSIPNEHAVSELIAQDLIP